MSYDHTLYVGWYITYKPSQLKVEIAPKSKRQCTGSKNHKLPAGAKFCPVCGSAIEEVLIPKYRGIGPLHHLLNERDPMSIEYETLGRGTVEEIEKLDEGMAIFPEFMPKPSDLVLMLPGYKQVEIHGDGFAQEIDTAMNLEKNEAMHAYIQLAHKVFDIQDVELKFGVVMDVR